MEEEQDESDEASIFMIERTAFLFDTPNYHKYTWTSTEQNDSTSNGLDGYN